MSSKKNLFGQLPSVERLLQDAELKRLAIDLPKRAVSDAARSAVEAVRRSFRAELDDEQTANSLYRQVLDRVRARLHRHRRSQYRRAINATGIILHTGLGRAPLPEEVLQRFVGDLVGYSVLQIGVEDGRRSRRDSGIEALLQELTGAEAATLVNNNAAATAIVLRTVGAGKEIIVSRGQLVEIGGSFRLPEVMEMSGAKLVAVGTTNKTRARDYEEAINENTAAILRVHPSNYRVSGETAEVPLKELIHIAHCHDLAMIDDLGAGALIDMSQFGFEPEPLLRDSIAAGADLVTCSADKLIGGAQGGIIMGRAKWIERVRKNPFARIVRPGKLSLLAVETTLALFLDEAQAFQRVPTLRILRRSVEELEEQARQIIDELGEIELDADVELVDGFSRMGSGSLPGQSLPTHLVAVAPRSISAAELAARMRRNATPIFARIQAGRVLIDPRTLLDGDASVVVAALSEMLAKTPSETPA